MSTSDRRSGSSGASRKRKTARISTAPVERPKPSQRTSRVRPVEAPHDGRSNAARQKAAQRKAEREARLAARRRSSRLVALSAVAVVAVVLGACVALYSSPLFTITSVEVTGHRHLSAQRIRQLADVEAGATLIRFPASAVARRVMTDPWVDEVSVSRVFPSGMRIRVTERVPIAAVVNDHDRWLIDGDAMIIALSSTAATGTKVPTETARAAAGLPLVKDVPGLDPKAGRKAVSEPLVNAVEILTGISPELARLVDSVSAPTVDGTTIVTSSRVEIVFGQAVDLQVKDSLARRILREQRKKVVSIDVRVIDRPTWRGLK